MDKKGKANFFFHPHFKMRVAHLSCPFSRLEF